MIYKLNKNDPKTLKTRGVLLSRDSEEDEKQRDNGQTKPQIQRSEKMRNKKKHYSSVRTVYQISGSFN